MFTSIAEQADHAAKIMPPSAVEAVYAMCHGCPPTTNFMRSISEMLRISLPEFEKLEYSISDGCGCTAGCGSWMVLHFKNGYSSLHIQISGYSRIEILSQAVQSANAVRYTENYKASARCVRLLAAVSSAPIPPNAHRVVIDDTFHKADARRFLAVYFVESFLAAHNILTSLLL